MRKRHRVGAAAAALVVTLGTGAAPAHATDHPGGGAVRPFAALVSGHPFVGPEECEPEMPGRTQCGYRIAGTATATYIGTVRSAAGDWLAAMTEFFSRASQDAAGRWRTPFTSTVWLARSDGTGTLVIDESGVITGTVAGPAAIAWGTDRVMWGTWVVDAWSSGRFSGATGGGRLVGAEKWLTQWSEILRGTITFARDR